MYELIQLAKNTYLIPAYTMIGVYVDNDTVTLIDSGIDDDTAIMVDKVLTEKGWTPTNIIITHSHADHIGGSNYFYNKYHSTILCYKTDNAIAENSLINTALLYGGLPFSKMSNKMLYAKPVTPTALTEQTLPKGLEIIELPGHATVMIGVKTSDKVFFCADSYLGKDTLEKFPMTYVLYVGKYLETLDKLPTIDAKIFVPSHTAPTTDVRPFVELNKQVVMQNIKDILSLMTSPIEINDLMDKYCKTYGYTLKTSQFFVTTATLKNYLSYLESEQLVEGYVENNRLMWKRTDKVYSK